MPISQEEQQAIVALVMAELLLLGVAPAKRRGLLESRALAAAERGPAGEPGRRGDRGPPGERGEPGQDGRQGEQGPKGDSGSAGPQGDPGPKGDQGDAGPKGDQGDAGPKGDKGDKGDQGIPGPSGTTQRFSVNSGAVDSGYSNGSIVLRTGGNVNPAGAYVGGGTGNKAIFGVFGFDGLSIGALNSISFTFTSHLGPGGPFFNPPGAGTTLTPYINVLIDFNPAGPSDIRLAVLMDDSLNPLITNSIGTYSNPGGLNILAYSWTSAMHVIIVGSPPAAAPGGVLPDITVPGPVSHLNNSFKWSDLVSANPTAKLVDAYPADNGFAAGAVMPSILLISGDSGNTTKSGKRIHALSVNGNPIVP